MGEHRFNEYCDQSNESIMREVIDESELAKRANDNTHERRKNGKNIMLDDEHFSK